MQKVFYLLFLYSSITYGQNPLVIAHRGGAGTAPENTIAAFENAIAVNADYYELDVRISSDDSLVIMHDGTIDRTTNGTGLVSAKTYAELRVLDAGSWFSDDFAGEKVPTLWEALVLAKNDVNNIGVVIEIKASASIVAPKIVELVQKLDMESRVIVSGFSLAQMTEVKTLDPTIPVQLFGIFTEAMVDQVAAINGNWVGSGGTITQSIVNYAQERGIYFNVWTVNTASSMLPLIALGVDAISTDYPEIMIALMDDTEPSDVVLNSAISEGAIVTLNWEEAKDNESRIVAYDIYRDETPNATSLLASVGNITEYVDNTCTELTQYYYRVKARNLFGLSSVNYSNEGAVETHSDVIPPVITSISSRGDSITVVVGYSEMLDRVSAETATNFTLSNEASVESAKLSKDLRSVILRTSPLSEQSYILTAEKVLDRAIIPNPMENDNKLFMHYGIPESAVAFYKLDSLSFSDPNSLVIDESENKNIGIVRNGAFLSGGVLGNAMVFDGIDDYVEFTASGSFDINESAVTLALWTKLPYAPSDMPDSYAPLFDSETDNYVLYGDKENGELRFKVVTTGAERPGIPSADIPAGEWIHLAGVYDGESAKVYLNGVLKDSHPLTGTVKLGQVATLGKTGSYYFEGSIDQVEVYNRALSKEEIRAMVFSVNTSINVMNVDVSLFQSEGVLTANILGGNYKWLDCDNGNAVIAGETGQSFTPSVSGNYSVEIIKDGCIGISACESVMNVGLCEYETSGISIYPNPNHGQFTLKNRKSEVGEINLGIFSTNGKVIYKENLNGTVHQCIDMPEVFPGIYIVRISLVHGVYNQRMVVL